MLDYYGLFPTLITRSSANAHQEYVSRSRSARSIARSNNGKSEQRLHSSKEEGKIETQFLGKW